MKKIAIISYNHPESTLPLVKYISKMNYKVDYYFITTFCTTGSSAFEFGEKAKIGLSKLQNAGIANLYDYFENKNSEIFLLTPITSLQRFGKGISFFLEIFRKIHFRLLIKRIANNYDYINIVGQNDLLIEAHKIIKKAVVIHSLHEVCNHYSQDYKPTKLIKYLINNQAKVVLHSKKTYIDFLKLSGAELKNIRIINFGLFETYSLFDKCTKMPFECLAKNFILFYGRITPYKGIPILIDAINKIDASLFQDTKVIIAGKGIDKNICGIFDDQRYIVLNRYISNQEIVALNKLSKVIICPYLSASQSGITQTTFLFQKPIIATNVGGFMEFIKDHENGLLIEPNDSQALGQAISEILASDDLYNSLIQGVKEFSNTNHDYNWINIAKKYVDLFEEK